MAEDEFELRELTRLLVQEDQPSGSDAGRRAPEETAREPQLEAEVEPLLDLHRSLKRMGRAFQASAERLSREVPAPDARRVAERYRLGARLGGRHGSRVRRAFDEWLFREVVIKFVDSTDDATAAEATRAEGAALAQLDHPGVVRVHDVGLSGEPFVAMEFLSGPSLEDVLQALRGARPTAEDPALAQVAVHLATPLARLHCALALGRALAYCHGRGVLHRDLKPANAVFRQPDQPVWVDLGLAHQRGLAEDLRTGITKQFIGTADYVAPEQVTAQTIGADPQSDLYSLATVTFELVTLRHPFPRPTAHEVMAAIEKEPAPSALDLEPSLPVAVAQVLAKALSKSPAQRQASVAEFVAALEIAAAGGTPPADQLGSLTPVRAPARARRFTRREGLWAGAAAALFGAYGLWPRSEARERLWTMGDLRPRAPGREWRATFAMARLLPPGSFGVPGGLERILWRWVELSDSEPLEAGIFRATLSRHGPGDVPLVQDVVFRFGFDSAGRAPKRLRFEVGADFEGVEVEVPAGEFVVRVSLDLSPVPTQTRIEDRTVVESHHGFAATPLITLAQWLRYEADSGRKASVAPFRWQGPQSPAFVTWEDAAAFGRWYGRRLPTSIEAAAIWRSGDPETAGLRRDPTQFKGEYVCDLYPADRSQVAYFDLELYERGIREASLPQNWIHRTDPTVGRQTVSTTCPTTNFDPQWIEREPAEDGSLPSIEVGQAFRLVRGVAGGIGPPRLP
jgi:hypothetical protein